MSTLSSVNQMRRNLILSIGLLAGTLLLVRSFNNREIQTRTGGLLSDPPLSTAPTAMPSGNKETATASSQEIKPVIISRQEWKAKDALGGMKIQTPNRITIHHTASPQQKEVSVEEKMRKLQSF